MPSGSVKWPPRKKLVFTEEVKEVLRKPAGKLITGKPEEVAEKVAWIVEFEEPPLVVAVGDYTSRTLRERGVPVNLYVMDGKIERKPAEHFEISVERVEHVVNEPGTISPEAASKLHKLLNDKRLGEALLMVEGEEDLLTLAAILSAPDGTLIIYGQPGKGCVVVKVRDAARELAQKILKMLEK